MNKNLFEISQEEKNRIRGLHESYANKPGTRLTLEQGVIYPTTQNQELDVFYFGVESKDTPRLYHNNNSIYYFDGTTSTEIWDKNSKVSFAVDLQTGKLENGSELMDEQISLQPTFKDFLVKGGFGPLNYEWENQKLPTFYLVMFGDQGKMFLSAAAPVLISRRQAKSEKLTKAVKEGDYIYAEIDKTYIPTKKGNALVAKMSFGKEISKVQPPTPTPPPVIPDYTFTLTDVFKFDSDELKEPTSLDTAINEFKRFMNRVVQKRIQNEILNTDVKILGYASSDGNPEERDGGNLAACSQYGKGKGPRKDYDKCLSQKRAEVVANRINDTLKSIPIMYGNKASTLGELYPESTSNWAKAVGMGQNSEVSKIKWDTPGHTVEKTADDRRIVFTPTLTTKI